MKTTLQVRDFDFELMLELKRYSKKEGKSLLEIVDPAIRNYIDGKKPEKLAKAKQVLKESAEKKSPAAAENGLQTTVREILSQPNYKVEKGILYYYSDKWEEWSKQNVTGGKIQLHPTVGEPITVDWAVVVKEIENVSVN